MIYFDYTATTKPSKEIIELHNKINNEYWYNSETLYKEGSRSKNLLEKSEQVVLETLNLKNKRVLFTSGATESNNTAIYSICKPYFKEPKHLITSTLEHASVLKSFQDLEKRGFKVTYLKPNKQGIIDINELKQAINNDTILVSIMWVNNIIGSIQPINEIIDIIKTHQRCKLHVDAVAGFGKIKNDFNFNDIDLITLSGHKLHGLKGTGALIFNDKLTLSYLMGGHQQYTFRPGTVDLAGSVTMAKVIQLSTKDIETKFNDVKNKFDYLVNNLKELDHIYLSLSNNQSPYILSITFKNIKGETVLHSLEQKDILVGTGSACNSHSKDQELSLVDTLPKNLNPINTIRVSLSNETTISELDKLIASIKELK